jgi:hypothetical protein
LVGDAADPVRSQAGFVGLIVNLLLVVPAPAHRTRNAGVLLRTPNPIEKE